MSCSDVRYPYMLRPPKPPELKQNPQPLRPPGATVWVPSHWSWFSRICSWRWVQGYWRR